MSDAYIVRALRRPHGQTLYERAYWCDEAAARRRFADDWAAEQRRCPPELPAGATVEIVAAAWRPPSPAALAALPTDPTPPYADYSHAYDYDWAGV